MNLRKHINCRDAAAEFIKTLYIPEKRGYKVKLMWWNIVSAPKIFPIHSDKVFIKQEDMVKWKAYEV